MRKTKFLYFDLEFSGCLRLITFRYNRFGLVYVTNGMVENAFPSLKLTNQIRIPSARFLFSNEQYLAFSWHLRL